MLKNKWYVVLESREVNKYKPLSVTRFGERLVFWRDNQGRLTCLTDVCPHRGAALSLGKIKNDCIQCPFHGFEFDRDGNCLHIPANGPDTIISGNYRVNAYEVIEKYGFVWLWYGQKQGNYPNIPFFEYLNSDFSYSGFKVNWETNYTRAIENQLDVSHLPFVHKNTIGKGGNYVVDGPAVEAGEDFIKVWVHNHRENIKRITDEKQIESFKNGQASLEFRFPNIWALHITDKFYQFLAFVPVSENKTLIYLRGYQSMVKQPFIRNIFNRLNLVYSQIILNQDKAVVESQLPNKSYARMPEKLLRSDLPINIFRKMYEKFEVEND